MATAAYLYVAAVNFSASLFDTQDLRTIRGSGLAMLEAPQRLGTHLRARFGDGSVAEVYVGASEGLFAISDSVPAPEAVADTARAFLEQPTAPGAAPLDHLTFTVGLRSASGADTSLADDGPSCFEIDNAAALSAARMAQMALPSFVPPAVDENGMHAGAPVCQVDGVRPAVEMDGTRPAPLNVSGSVLARGTYGRRQRVTYYRCQFPAWTGASEFAQSLHDLTAIGAEDLAPPEQLGAKMAVLYFDGNGFGAIRGRHCRTPDRLSAFSDGLLDLRSALMGDLLQRFEEEPGLAGLPEARRAQGLQMRRVLPPSERALLARGDGEAEPKTQLRFDMLLWGGDELMMVMPAWAGWAVAGLMAAGMQGWAFRPDAETADPLRHAGGLVFCNIKTPVREVKDLAATLADEAKAASRERDLIQVQIVESIDLPPGYLGDHRRRLFGAVPPAAFCFDAGAWAETTEAVRWLKRHLPRSQLYRQLRRATAEGALREQAGPAAEGVLRAVNDYLASALSPGEMAPAWFASLGGSPASRLMPLVHLAELWDYVDPFESDEATS